MDITPMLPTLYRAATTADILMAATAIINQIVDPFQFELVLLDSNSLEHHNNVEQSSNAIFVVIEIPITAANTLLINSAEPLSKADVSRVQQKLEPLIPHLKQSVTTFLKLKSDYVAGQIKQALLDRHSLGLIGFSEKLDVVFINQAAQALLAASPFMAFLQDSCIEAIGSAIAGRISEDYSVQSLLYHSPELAADYQVVVVSAPNYGIDLIGQVSAAVAAIVCLYEKNRALKIHDKVLHQFQLTKKEMDLCQQLVNGKSIHEIAQQQHRSVHTLRTQLKKVFNKTNCHSQVELMLKLFTYLSPELIVDEFESRN